MTSYKKFIIALGALVVLAGGLYALSYLIARPSQPSQSQPPAESPITLTGKLACLPHKGDGPHTQECAIGLQTNNGAYYALQDMPPTAPEVNASVEVTGQLRDSHDEAYDTAGMILVQSVKAQ